MIVKAESTVYPDFGFEKKMTRTDNSIKLIYRCYYSTSFFLRIYPPLGWQGGPSLSTIPQSSAPSGIR